MAPPKFPWFLKFTWKYLVNKKINSLKVDGEFRPQNRIEASLKGVGSNWMCAIFWNFELQNWKMAIFGPLESENSTHLVRKLSARRTHSPIFTPLLLVTKEGINFFLKYILCSTQLYTCILHIFNKIYQIKMCWHHFRIPDQEPR